MIKKSAEMAYTSKHIKSSKWLLLLCAASAAAVDLAITVLLIIGGMGATYLICPIVLFIFDVIYFVISLFFTNFRFKYSIAVWISYMLFFALGMVVELCLLLGGSGTVITNGALIMWAVVHGLNIVCAIVTALFASRVLKYLWVGIVFAVVFIFSCAAYTAYIIPSGFFGQGMDSRPLVYRYNGETGEYTAIDVLAGRSDKVAVPKLFNGKPVTALSFNVLANGGVKEYSFSADIRFTDEEALERQLDLEGKKIYVEKGAVNDVRATLFGYESDGTNGNAVALANATLPENLEEGEGYVAFSYDLNAFNISKGKVVPVYVGDLSAFNFNSYTAEYDYITYRDADNTEHLDYAYKHGGYILSDIAGENGSVFGGVSQSTVAELKFDKIYRVTVESGNDKKYDEHEKQPEFCFDTVGGDSLGYRYLTLGKAASFTAGLNGRKGFSLKWLYYDGAVKKNLEDLPSVLGGLDGSDLTVAPLWSLNDPTVRITSTAANGAITYGEDVTFTAAAEVEAEGVELEYRWALGGEPVTDYTWTGESVSLEHPKPEVSGEYKLVVLVHGGEVTSLSSFGTASVNLNIAKKPVEFVWTAPADLVYDGADKVVRFDFDRSQLVGDDDISYTVPVGGGDDGYVSVSAGAYTVKYAGTYSPVIVVSGADAVNYDAGNTVKYSFTVDRRSIAVEWSDYDTLVYNGGMQGPKAQADGMGTDGNVVSGVTGLRVNAGDNYTATAVLGNDNYILTEATRTYSIKKAPLTVTAGKASAVYGSQPDTGAIELTYDGFVNNETAEGLGGRPDYTFAPSVGGADYSVGVYENGVAVSGYTSNNYDITYASGELTITKRPVTVGWRGTENLVYNAREKEVTAYVVNLVGNDDVSITVQGGDAINHGTHTAEATALTGARAGNYELVDGLTREYTIGKASVTVTALPKSSVYGSPAVELEVAVTGEIYNDEIAYEVSWEEGVNAGDYEIVCVLTLENDNYEVICENGVYTIEPLPVEVKWEGYDRLAYNSQAKNVTAAVTNVIGEDDVSVIVTGGDAVDAGSHTAVATGLQGEDAANYSVPDGLECNYMIDPATPTIRAVDKTSVYGEPEEELTIEVIEGEIFNDELEIILSKPNNKNVGEYNIFCTTKYNPNYLVTVIPGGKYTITEREITIIWSNNRNLVYDGTEKTVTAEIGGMGLAAGEGELYRFENMSATEAGTYTARFILDGSIANNYKVNNAECVYTIEQAESELTVSLNGVAVDSQTIEAFVGDVLSWECNTDEFSLITTTGGAATRDEDPQPELPVSDADIPEDRMFSFDVAGTYEFSFTVGGRNYKEKTLIIRVTVSDKSVDDGSGETGVNDVI